MPLCGTGFMSIQFDHKHVYVHVPKSVSKTIHCTAPAATLGLHNPYHIRTLRPYSVQLLDYCKLTP